MRWTDSIKLDSNATHNFGPFKYWGIDNFTSFQMTCMHEDYWNLI